MFEHYQNEVVSVCRSKLAANQLPHLNAISPAMLRQECLNVFKERHDPKKDDVALRMFFGPDDKNKGYLKIIDAHPTEKFKALSVFFKRPNDKKPDQKNLELLAWLIDFEGRPYQPKKGYDISTPIDNNEEILVEDNLAHDVEISPVDVENKDSYGEAPQGIEDRAKGQDLEPERESTTKIRALRLFTDIDPSAIHNRWHIPKKFHKTVYAFTAAAVVLASTYLIIGIGDKQCMYWNGERYEAVACADKPGDFSVIPFDQETANNLKRILRPDTLSENSVRKVWYNKVWSDSLDFYTDSGSVPANSNRRLMPMTNYILNKYVLQKRNKQNRLKGY
jgi:hypothetical protein